jgi:hypothetical protein
MKDHLHLYHHHLKLFQKILRQQNLNFVRYYKEQGLFPHLQLLLRDILLPLLKLFLVKVQGHNQKLYNLQLHLHPLMREYTLKFLHHRLLLNNLHLDKLL